MSSIASLWLPALVSAVFVFIASAIINTLLPWHHDDYARVPNEDAVIDAVRQLALPPGQEMVPRPSSMQDMKSPEFLDHMARGPVFMLRMLPNGMASMGKTLAMWFVFTLVVSWLSGSMARIALQATPGRRILFHTVALTTFMSYAFGLWQMSIW